MTKYSQFMIDIETLGNTSNAAVVQIGCVGFNPIDGSVGASFKINVKPHEKSTMDFSTVQWWMGQSDTARKSVFEGQFFDPKEALEAFSAHIKEHASEYGHKVWSKPSTFDVVILENLYRHVGLAPPWAHWNTRCMRTILEAANVQRYEEVVPEVAHDAASDAQAQALTVLKCHEKLITLSKKPVDNGNA